MPAMKLNSNDVLREEKALFVAEKPKALGIGFNTRVWGKGGDIPLLLWRMGSVLLRHITWHLQSSYWFFKTHISHCSVWRLSWPARGVNHTLPLTHMYFWIQGPEFLKAGVSAGSQTTESIVGLLSIKPGGEFVWDSEEGRTSLGVHMYKTGERGRVVKPIFPR